MTKLMGCDSISAVIGQRPATINITRLGLLAGVLAAFGVRLFRLGAESLWYDETVSVMLASKRIPALLAHTAGDIHPPGYYLLLHFWRLLTGPTLVHGLEFLYAWPSLWAGVLTLALLVPLGRRLGSPSVALVALWLGAINPFHLWYSQEVRMYTVAAALGLLCLWALLKAATPGGGRWLVVYALSAAAGLYTLYYVLFLLIALNALAGLWLKPGTRLRWVVAQSGVLLLWLPWLPTFWRQALDPPVPPWRAPWPDFAAFAASLGESLSALLVGQSPPGGVTWPWALLTLLLLVTSIVTWHVGSSIEKTTEQKETGITSITQIQKRENLRNRRNPCSMLFVRSTQHARGLTLLLYVFLPVFLIYLLTATVTPIYHVRYLFPYAPPFLLLVAGAIVGLRQVGWGWAAGTLALLFALNGWSLFEFWHNPAYRADDHRAAVAQLAAEWRPGDVILVNAGWVYPALQTYWPSELGDPLGALPPPLDSPQRLLPSAPGTTTPDALTRPQLIRTGSVDGAATLGWGDPASDFFAVSHGDTQAALAQLTGQARRIWHYRLYDTVSDPHGVIRHALEEQATLHLDQPVPGRDFLRLQRYDIPSAATRPLLAPQAAFTPFTFDDILRLVAITHPASAPAGTMLYVETRWQALTGLAALSPDLGFSLRLYAADDTQLAQQDEALPQPLRQWPPNTVRDLPLALPIPAAAIPGDYALSLLVYDRITGTPLASSAATPTGVPIGNIAITGATPQAVGGKAIARFDYLHLLAASPTQTTLSPDMTLAIRLLWHPQPSPYRDTFLGVFTLRRADGTIAQQWSEPLGGWAYPSGGWPTGVPVLDRHDLAVPAATPPGPYTLTLHLVRASDEQPVAARVGWWSPGQAEVVMGAITLVP